MDGDSLPNQGAKASTVMVLACFSKSISTRWANFNLNNVAIYFHVLANNTDKIFTARWNSPWHAGENHSYK